MKIKIRKEAIFMSALFFYSVECVHKSNLKGTKKLENMRYLSERQINALTKLQSNKISADQKPNDFTQSVGAIL